MTFSIPDGFSLEQLQQMMENAPSESCEHDEDSCTCGGVPQTPSQKRIFKDCQKALNGLDKKHRDPAVMKFIAMLAIDTLCQWHKSVAESRFEGSDIQGLGWAMDARSLEIAEDIISRINVGPNDFLTE